MSTMLTYCTWAEGDVFAYRGVFGWYAHLLDADDWQNDVYHFPTFNDFCVMMNEFRRRGLKIPDYAWITIEEETKSEKPVAHPGYVLTYVVIPPGDL